MSSASGLFTVALKFTVITSSNIYAIKMVIRTSFCLPNKFALF